MSAPRIGSSFAKAPNADETVPGGPAPDAAPAAEEGTVHDFRELVEPLGVAPEPPQCILTKLKQADKVWRWLSEPQVNKLGMRMYETYSPDARERELINSGKDAPPGVRVDVENRVRWLDDAFLGVLNRRYFLQRQDMKRARVKQLTDLSRDQSKLKEQAARVGASVDVKVKRWRAEETDDREPA